MTRLLLVFVMLILSLVGVANPSSVSASVDIAQVASGANSADANSYDTSTVTISSDKLSLLYVTAGRTDGTAGLPTGVSGLNTSWELVSQSTVGSGNLRSALYQARSASGTGAVTVAYAGLQHNFTWQLVDAGSAENTVAQQGTVSTTSTAPAVTLGANIGVNSATVGFIASNSTTQTVSSGAGYAAIGSQTTGTGPTIRSAAEWRTDGQKKVDFAASGTTQKTVIAVEIAESTGPVIDPSPGDTVAVIGDSLTYQDGSGSANISAKLVAAGYDPANIYIYGVGGKKITVADSTGKTTVQNIAEARAQLGTVDHWIIALGTNNPKDTDAVFVANINTVLDAIGSQGDVVWVGVGFYRITNNNAVRLNPMIAATVGARANGHFADWNNFIHNGRDETGLWVYPVDSTHMTAAGYDIRNDFYVQQLPVTP